MKSFLVSEHFKLNVSQNAESTLSFLFDQSQSQNPFPRFFLVNRAAPIFVSLAFGPHSCASTVNATVDGWKSGRTVCFTPMLFPEVLNAKQGNCMHHFSSLWFDSIGYRTPIYLVQCEHSMTGPLRFDSLQISRVYCLDFRQRLYHLIFDFMCYFFSCWIFHQF